MTEIKNTNTRKSIKADICDYTVIDLETTDVNIYRCEIIEVSAVKVRNNKIVDQFSTLVKPEGIISSLITSITGITNDMIKNSPNISEVLPDYLDFIGDDIILGHNVACFDRNIIKIHCERLGLPPFMNDTLDTLRYSQKCDLDVPNRKLTTLTQYFGISHEGAHRALADCIANHECYQQLKKYYKG